MRTLFFTALSTFDHEVVISQFVSRASSSAERTNSPDRRATPRGDGIGTLAWTERTRGVLSASDRLKFTATGVHSQLVALPDRVAHALGLRKDRLARVDVTAVQRPDSAA